MPLINIVYLSGRLRQAGMAQVVAHFIGNEEVGGSSPLVSLKN